eukprot:scaffold1766_cov401-Prasinococcus_capsulatus_cf.AAC.12
MGRRCEATRRRARENIFVQDRAPNGGLSGLGVRENGAPTCGIESGRRHHPFRSRRGRTPPAAGDTSPCVVPSTGG